MAAPSSARARNTITKSNAETINHIRTVMQIFVNSEAELRPHFFLTGESGASKTHTINALCDELKLDFLTVNAAQLTKEGTSGNSLSKALSPLLHHSDQARVVFVDEFDKLFIAGNTNTQLAHETTAGVQNEFLHVLESQYTAVFGDYGKYVNVRCDNILFVFAGAFNGEKNITLDRLRDFGIKTEFLGRVGLLFGMTKVSLEDMERILNESSQLARYLKLFTDAKKADVVKVIMEAVRENYDKNTIGIRILTTLVHQYFINGGRLIQQEVKASTFQKTMSLGGGKPGDGETH
jgi:ATP-dependent protease Clp ATPase subunit